MRYACPCCGCLTLDEPPPGTFAVCPVCWWEDDDVQLREPAYTGGANQVSLNDARANYARIGASSEEGLAHIRKPSEDELPR